ncbi:hypothetical protein V1525DRAFT_410897 [Lipomyces kononenkoae]|uniref:Uncharacterized protein n=1 Tax=Lipomyces kononenkoae TaxID=34357 RepID=A0ACC3SU17_LIPKO
MPQSASYGLHGVWNMHESFAKFRLPAIYGGQPNVVLDVSIANDTGSNMKTIFSTDLVKFWVTTLICTQEGSVRSLFQRLVVGYIGNGLL